MKQRLLSIAIAFLGLLPLLTGTETAAVGTSVQEKAAILVQRESLQSVREAKPELDSVAFMAFLADNTPDLLEEWKRRCAEEPETALAYLNLLVDHYEHISAVQKDNPAEYERLLEQQRTESRARQLARQIQLLPEQIRTAPADKAEVLTHKLDTAREELKKLLQDSFDEAQARQLFDLNRLESEVRDLRRLVEERATNRQFILEQRFQVLTGESWRQPPAKK